MICGPWIRAEAKMTGMTDAELIFNGKWLRSPLVLLRALEDDCWIGILLSDICMRTTKMMIATYMTIYAMKPPMPKAEVAVGPRNVSYTMRNVVGISATIPAKMIIDVPLPIPFDVIWSASHSKKNVPAVKITEIYS